ncbi:hypothetical protein QBC45DRAFT_34976 [Copromyces sp. CBS 386.78]|nr:hypothetical protein QBC45DRAFT_34976 [Copromyces sp. CBS 386.78]
MGSAINCIWPSIDRTAAPSSFGASIGGPMDYDLWCGSSISPLGPPIEAPPRWKDGRFN